MTSDEKRTDPHPDHRIRQYRAAASAMRRGFFQVDVPTTPEDDLAELGRALVELGQTLERKFRELDHLAAITERINAGLVLDDVLNYVYQHFRDIIPYDRIGFSLLEDNAQTVRARWARSEAPVMKIVSGFSQPLAATSLGRILETNEPRILNDLESYLRAHPASVATKLVVEEGMRSSLTCPLVANGKAIGFMFFSSMKPNTYRDAHVVLFAQVAGQLAVIVEKGRLYEQLLNLSQEKSRVLGVVAHDLRNPIGIVKGLVDLIVSGAAGSVTEQQRTVLERVRNASEGMLSLVNDLLDVTAIESGRLDLEPQTTDVRAYLSEYYQTHALLAQTKDITLRLEVASGIPDVMLDGKRIAQVLDNLVTNAIKYSYPNTTVTLRARQEADSVVIAVEDQGQGIPEEDLPKLFTEFGRANVRPTGGEKSTGLGLAITKRIVVAHGGRIWVESVVGKGSTFAFSIPLEAPRSPAFS
jgi:hypothetical protein